MKTYVDIDIDGLPTAFYTDEIHGDKIPKSTVEITQDQWLEFINNNGLRKWKDGEIVRYEPPILEPTMEEVRSTRDRLLKESDWTQLPDVALSDDDKLAWVKYRQKLRDITKLKKVVWPKLKREKNQ